MTLSQEQAGRIARITKALLKLSAARREKLDKVDFETFVEGLTEFEPDFVEIVCGDFARISPEPYQPRFPALHTLREACHRTADMARERKALKAAKEERPDPLTDAQWANLRRLFQRSLPGSPLPSWLQPKAKEREA